MSILPNINQGYAYGNYKGVQMFEPEYIYSPSNWEWIVDTYARVQEIELSEECYGPSRITNDG